MRILGIIAFPVVAAALVVGAYLAPSDSASIRRPSEVTVTESSYACPAGKGITVAAGQLDPGTARGPMVLPSRSAEPRLDDARAWSTSVVDGAGVIIRQEGRASGAVGFFASRASKSGGGGLAVGSCPGVTDDAWFLGLGSGGKHFSTLVLANLADAPAAVDLSIWGPEGKIDAVDTEGVVVKPFTIRRIRLEDLAAGESELAIRVHRRRGSLSAIVNDSSTGVYRGTEPIATTASPRRSQVVGGLVKGSSGRTLALLNAGGDTARVDVEVIGSKNTFALAGLEKLKVPAGSLRLVTVPSSAGGERQALRVTSDQPVAATVRMAPSAKDYAYAESVPALEGPTIVPVDLGKLTDSPELIMAAPIGKASVELEAFDSSMRSVGTATVDIPAGTTQHVDTAKVPEGKGVAYIVLRPNGDVIAAATYKGKGGAISSLALVAAPVTVLSPQVRPIG